jgi:hypothetical protein
MGNNNTIPTNWTGCEDVQYTEMNWLKAGLNGRFCYKSGNSSGSITG